MKTSIRQNEDKARKLTFVIETFDDYALATRRVAALRSCSKDHSAAQELIALLKAVTAWDARQSHAAQSQD